ncbi:MAG: hypothetical protein NNA21_02330 [Nitrospira sp.]|nr:hypothetical protein [Nitrospira sp.]
MRQRVPALLPWQEATANIQPLTKEVVMWNWFERERSRGVGRGFAALALGLALVQGVESQAVEYYVGLDGRDVIPTGTYAGEISPNDERLTFL